MTADQGQTSSHSSNYQHLRLVIIGSVAFVLIALIAFSAWNSYEDHQNVITNAEEQTRSYARALKEHAERTFSEVDLVIQTTVRQIESAGGLSKLSPFEQRLLLSLRTRDIPQIGSLSTIDSSGQMQATSLPEHSNLLNLAQRQLYQFHRNNNSDLLFINPPFKSRITGKWRFTLSRRINGPSGTFAGIVMAAIEISYFEQLYLSVVPNKNARFTLASTNGDYLVLIPTAEDVYSSAKKTAPFFRKLVATMPANTYHNRSSNIAREYRIVSYNRLDKFPVVAVMSVGRNAALAGWRVATIKQGFIIFFIILLVIVLTNMLLQQIRLLDHKVQDRTSLLLLANRFLEKEIEDRKQIESNLLNHQQKIESMACELSLAEDRERERIAGELHDQVGQRLIYCKLKLDGLANEASNQETLQDVTEVGNLVEQSLRDIRSLTFQLRPPILASAGFIAALQWLTEELNRDYGLAIECHTADYDVCLKQPRYEIRSALFQATRELLLNVIKHAGVSTARLLVRRESDLLTICITDSGIGFSPQQELATPSTHGGFGLYNLRQKIEFLGGNFLIESSSNTGTRATITLHLKDEYLEE